MKTTKEFGTNLPKKITLQKNEHKIVVFNKIADNEIILEENSSLTLTGIITKGDESFKKILINLRGDNSKLKLVIIIIGKKNEQFNFETISAHSSQNTKASLTVLSAMFDSSSINYKGNILIEKGAKKTNSKLTHKTLILSSSAKAKTIPSLEIKEDDVIAGHSASVGKPDEETLFYLQSRGLDKNSATNVLVEGFLEAGANLIADNSVKDILIEEIKNAL